MRLTLALCLLALPAAAWEFAPRPVCTLSQTGQTSVRVTFDGATYAIHLTHPDGWPPGPVFSIVFAGPAGLTISTDRHSISGRTLTVTDSGFGNVLNGLQYNTKAIARIGGVAREIDLAGAAPAVEAFRACPSDAVSGTAAPRVRELG